MRRISSKKSEKPRRLAKIKASIRLTLGRAHLLDWLITNSIRIRSSVTPPRPPRPMNCEHSGSCRALALVHVRQHDTHRGAIGRHRALGTMEPRPSLPHSDLVVFKR